MDCHGEAALEQRREGEFLSRLGSGQDGLALAQEFFCLLRVLAEPAAAGRPQVFSLGEKLIQGAQFGAAAATFGIGAGEGAAAGGAGGGHDQ